MVYHPAGIVVARFLIHTLRECGASDEAVTLHLLPFIKDVWPFVKSPQHLHQLAMLLVTSRQATSGSTHVLAAVFETLGALFVLNTSEAEVVSYARFPMDKFPALYAALLEMRPNVNDTHLLPLWLATVVDGLCMHTEQDADAAATHTFGKAFDAIFGLLALTPNTKSVAKTVHVCIRQALEAVVEMAVTDGMIKEALQGGERVHVTPAFKSMVDKVTRGLSLAYQSGWGVVLETIRALLERLFKFDCASNAANDNSAETAALSLMTATLTSLSDDKVYAQNQYFAHHDQLKRVLGTAIRTLGPRRFLVIFPLNMAAAEDQPADDTSATTGPARTWLLPLLKEHVANTELQFFLDYFIPLSQRVAEHGQRLVLAEKAVEGKTCAVVWRQLWDLLPCFCVAPTDLKEVACGRGLFCRALVGELYPLPSPIDL